ncbi:hypothetical protein [Streptomyces sp. 769]|uniref:hypothetical protein n=1 Tax=Streptomyces sp. 769 TaxID=1262452 RepID=UPI000581D6DB|nr:hypothetical protein [Streptomyces sp. 769]AJC56473.1 hypothetical protein GZL_03887 [Streptomyces sp. 769]
MGLKHEVGNAVARESAAPEPTVRESVAPEPTVRQSAAPESTVRESVAPEPTVWEVGAPAPRTFRIDIGELVLDGFDARTTDPDRVSAAFQAELTRLVRDRGVPLAAAGDGSGLALDGLAGLPPLPATTHPVRLGEALARAVHAGLTGRGEAR